MNKIWKFIISLSLLVSFVSCSSSIVYTPKINDSNEQTDYTSEISIVTYNIQTVFGKGNDKVVALTDYLNSQKYDFVLMQEVFDERARNYFAENLDSSFYKGKVPRVDYASFPSNICQDAGLFSFSSFPIVDLSQYDFGKNTEHTDGAIHQMLVKEFSPTFDLFANKSVLGTLHQINDTTKLFMFTTHLQAISSRRHRTNQLKQIQAFIENSVITVLRNGVVDSPQNLLVLITGDFNYDAYDEDDVETLQKYLGQPRDLHKEYHEKNMEYSMVFPLFGFYRRFDFIYSYDKIGEIPLKQANIKSINVTDVKESNGKSISDHLAVKTVLHLD